MKKKKIKTSAFDEVYYKCNKHLPCDCGKSMMCEDLRNQDDLCEEEYCPLLKKGKK